MLRALLFFLSEALESMRRHPAATMAALVSMTSVLFVLSLLLVITYNVRVLTEELESRKGIVVFLESDRPEGRRKELVDIFKGFGEVESVRWIPREEALKEVEEELGGLDVDEILASNPLPDAIVIQCLPDSRDAVTLSSLSTEIAAYEGVEDVLYGEEWVESLDRSLMTMRRVTLLVGCLCAVAVVLVLGATLRLTLVHRQGTLAIMRIIGATFGYIRGPFIVAGIVQVTLAGAISLILLRLVVSLGHRFLPGVSYLPTGWIVMLLAGAAVLGLAGSYFALEPVLRGMESGSRKKMWAGAAILIGCLAFGGLAGAQSSGTIATHEEDLIQLKAQIQTNRARILSLRSRQENLNEMIERLDTDLRLSRSYLEKLNQQEERLRADLDHRTIELDGTRERLILVRERLAGGVQDYYKRRRIDLAELLLSSETFPQLYARAHYLSWSIHQYRKDLLDLAEEESALMESAQELRDQQARLQRLQREKKAESSGLEARSKETLQEKAQVESELKDHLQVLKDLETREARTTQLLRELESQRRAAAGAGNGLESMKGRLPWPVEGDVQTGFGSHVHPRFKTRVVNRGVDIKAPAGRIFKAVAPGLVVYAEWLTGYGNCVILDHGRGYYTLYAHAQSILVQKNQSVAQGVPLGEVGETDSVRGAGLHFEIRQGAEALNPDLWLSKAR
ncbi:MAG: permease-like cell division protein FtsX [Candidatus Eisenbacteria bacterium]|nr:permease-like cell division protein FtsX [Candidatus Eisenbacteria bacterium]